MYLKYEINVYIVLVNLTLNYTRINQWCNVCVNQFWNTTHNK